MKLVLSLFFLVMANHALAVDNYELSSSELKQLKASSAYFKRNLGRVSVENFNDDEFRHFLKNELTACGAFSEVAEEKLRVRATAIDISDDSNGDSDVPALSGRSRTYHAKFKYELLDGENVVASWVIKTHGTSNSVTADRNMEAYLSAIKRNVRSFILTLKATYDPVGAEDARNALVALGSESDNTRSIVGSLFLGGVAVARTTAAAVDSVADGLADACRSDPSCMNGDNLRRSQANLDAQFAESQRAGAEMTSRAAAQKQQQVERQQREAAQNHVREIESHRQQDTSRQRASSQHQSNQQQTPSQPVYSNSSSGTDTSQNETSQNQRVADMGQQEPIPQRSQWVEALGTSNESSESSGVSKKSEKKAIQYKEIAVGSGRDGLQMCFHRELAEKQAYVTTDNNASRICWEEMGDGWRFDKVKFKGYIQCTKCRDGEFKCEVTDAVYVCKHY